MKQHQLMTSRCKRLDSDLDLLVTDYIMTFEVISNTECMFMLRRSPYLNEANQIFSCRQLFFFCVWKKWRQLRMNLRRGMYSKLPDIDLSGVIISSFLSGR